ncbi:MAG: threonylcarbamoyl-AMP synthase [Myxococcales bacterium]|nr:threonylcarbamoyl-AMP synthase [Myxococcales bacterium]
MLTRLALAEAADILRDGGVVLFPTETTYALGCLARDAAAVRRVVGLKARPEGRPLPVMLPDWQTFLKLTVESPLAPLAERFWPGPLTVVVPAFPGLPQAVTADTNMVGLRLSGHPVAQALMQRVGEPVVATSANRTGEPAAADLAACDRAGLEAVDGVLPGEGLTGRGSTVVGLAAGQLAIYREGLLPVEDLLAAWRALRQR